MVATQTFARIIAAYGSKTSLFVILLHFSHIKIVILTSIQQAPEKTQNNLLKNLTHDAETIGIIAELVEAQAPPFTRNSKT